jgi:hypothetical protein
MFVSENKKNDQAVVPGQAQTRTVPCAGATI